MPPDVVPGLSAHESARLASCVAIAMVLFLSAVVSSTYERGIGRRPLFALILALIGWCTVTLGAAMSGVGRLWPPLLALAPLLSGYIGPTMYAYTRQLTDPQRRVHPALFLLGLLGTTYSVLALSVEGGLDWARKTIVDSDPYWDPLLSPLMMAHSAQLVGLVLISTFLVTRAYISGAHPEVRKSQFQLLLVCWGGLLVLVFTNILPTFRGVVAQVEPAALTLPFAVVGVLIVRGLGADLASMREAQEAARELRMESLGLMARGLSHDLNNVLTGVVGHAELARLDAAEGAQAHHHLDEVISGCQRAAGLMERMLSFSGRRSRNVQVISSRPALEAASAAMASLRAPEQIVRTDLEDDLPHVRIDASELESAVINLLENALQALGEGSGTVTLRARREARVHLPMGAVGPIPVGCEGLRVEVEDPGRGMSAEVASRALEPFFTTRSNGKGLGLVNVLSTVVGADGALWFQSEPGQGTRFVFWLPASPPPTPVEQPPAGRLRGPCLLVEDDPVVADVSCRLLERLGLSVRVATSAEVALDIVSEGSLAGECIAVIDIRLPGMDGVELAERLLEQRAAARILLLSADEPGPRLQRFAEHPVLFRRKPLSLEGLRDALHRLLALSRGSASAPTNG